MDNPNELEVIKLNALIFLNLPLKDVKPTIT